MEFVFPKS